MPSWALVNPAYFTVAPGSITIQKMSQAGVFFTPIGAIFPFLKSLAGVPAMPANFLECNGQVVNDVDSPLNGQTLPNLNNSLFLCGAAASGATGGSATHRHAGSVDNVAHGNLYADPAQYTGYASNIPPYYSVVWIVRIK